MRRLATICGATLALTAAPANTADPALAAPSRVVLALFAHPDDEVTVAPALAAEARSGALVRIVYATSGDAGPGVSALAKGAELAHLREGEAACASAALGLPAPLLLRFGDGQLPGYARGADSAGRDLAGELKAAILAARPAVVITWGPDGGYGHADHRMVGALVTQIVQAMPATDRPRLIYGGFSAAAGPLPGGFGTWAQTAPDLLDVSVPYTAADLAAASKAAQCHASQFDAKTRQMLAPMLDKLVWHGAVQFRSAFPAPAPGR